MSSEKTGAAVPRRHPECYMEDANLVLQVEDYLFFFTGSQLRTQAPGIDDLLYLPSNIPGEGGSEAHPIPFLNKRPTVPQMVAMWKYINATPDDPPERTKEFCLDLLAASDFFICPAACRFALSGLDSKIFDPIERLVLARKYTIVENDWIEASVRSIWTRDLLTVTEEEKDVLGGRVVAIFALAKLQSDHKRRILAGHLPIGDFPRDAKHCSHT
ncbi:hypothetical protein C8J56DRAFT_1055546 [Mycena floridula]|nr:hypothetical protein C8J56DRAFT_1055546 [Mycena floridula]